MQAAVKPEGCCPKVSMIIPVGPDEQPDSPLVRSLRALDGGASAQEMPSIEYVFVCCPQSEWLVGEMVERFPQAVVLTCEQAGRAAQMNLGAAHASGDFLWFVHVDTELSASQIGVLMKALSEPVSEVAEKLWCFRLAFREDGRGPMKWNAAGANWRTRWLGVPFGDQALCISKAGFVQLEGYPLDVPYGEDHVFVWRARLAGFRISMLDSTVVTSASKYRHAGWLKLTLRYQRYWIAQALPFVWQRLKQKLS